MALVWSTGHRGRSEGRAGVTVVRSGPPLTGAIHSGSRIPGSDFSKNAGSVRVPGRFYSGLFRAFTESTLVREALPASESVRVPSRSRAGWSARPYANRRESSASGLAPRRYGRDGDPGRKESVHLRCPERPSSGLAVPEGACSACP